MFQQERQNYQLLFTDNAEALPLIAALRVEELAINNNKKPSDIFNNLKIHINDKDDSWEICNFRNLHYLDESMLYSQSDCKGIELQLFKFLTFAEDTNHFLQTITTNHFAWWPYLFCAQIQILCEVLKISPCEILYLFGISFVGNTEDLWENFQWKRLLQADSIIVSLHSNTRIFEN